MKQLYVKDSDIVITGIKEVVTCTANIDGFNEDGSPCYSGGSDPHWDDQKPVVGVDGGNIYLCCDGEEYRMDELEFRDDQQSNDSNMDELFGASQD